MSSAIQIANNIFLSDLIDIVITAILIYSLVLFLRKTKGIMVVLGLAIAVMLYLLAGALDLYLTYIALRYFVSVSAIIFVIIFQVEIRRYFEFIGLMGSRKINGKKSISGKSEITEIVEASKKLTVEKLGALIIIQGQDDLDSLIEGGKELDGIISEEILMSIFDSHTDGHDGAVLIRDNKIIKFGAQLPLSTNFKELGKHGTRHSAALGLSEICDAMCIVVSEEKRKVSIAIDGKLNRLEQEEDLEREVRNFLRRKFRRQKQSPFTHFIKRNLLLRAGALATSVVIWFFMVYQAGIVTETYEVPITFEKPPENIFIEEYSPKQITVNVSGRGEGIFADLSGEDFEYVYDASELGGGVTKHTIVTEEITTPPNVTIENITPDTLLLTSIQFVSQKIPVKASIVGELEDGLNNSETVVTPEFIEVLVEQGKDIPTEIYTQEIDISDLKETTIVPTTLQLPKGIKVDLENKDINVAITINED